MIQNNNKVKDKYKARIDKGKKCQMNLKDDLKGITLTVRALYRYGIAVLRKRIREYKKDKQRQQDDKHLIFFRNAAKIHQNRLQTYHELIVNNKKQDRSLYTAQDWTDYLIVRKRRDNPALPRGKSSGFKPKIIEPDSKIGHKSVMSIHEFFIDRDALAHLVDQAIHDMEGIGGASAVGANSMDQLFPVALLVNGAAALRV